MKRIEYKRGDQLPPNAVAIGPTGKFANPFTQERLISLGFLALPGRWQEVSVNKFRQWLGPCWWEVWCGPESIERRRRILESLDELRGKDLACFCNEGEACHGDILIEHCKASQPVRV